MSNFIIHNQMDEQHKRNCWCGSSDLNNFSNDYLVCTKCGTLVSQTGLSSEQAKVSDDSKDFYGKEYWLSHQSQELGFPDIYQRARQDLPERCLYWLRTLLAYKLPAAKVLELGCSHGGFVALMQAAGFNAVGLELSPWVVNFAKQTFNIPMLLGDVEEQQLEQQSFDAIVINDVLEHLSNPIATIRHCVSLLKPDGILIVQTPNYLEGKTYADMVANNDRFLEMLVSVEHLYLFNQRSIQELFKSVGCNTLQHKSALFDYDMYLVVSRQPLVENSREQISESLAINASGRIVQALLDKGDEVEHVRDKWQTAEEDREARLQVIHRQGEQIGQLQAQLVQNNQYIEAIEAEKEACLNRIEQQCQCIEEIEADKAARLEVIQQQGQHIQEIEADRAVRLEVIQQQGQHIQEIEVDRVARLEVIQQQGQHIQEIEADRAARLEVIQQQEVKINQLEGKLNGLMNQKLVKFCQRLKLIKYNDKASSSLCKESSTSNQLLVQDSVQLYNQQVDSNSTLIDAVRKFDTIEGYRRTIEAFNQSRPDMNSVRSYNHQMIDIFDSLRSLKGKKLLDIGASPHGYAMEQALLKHASAYVGIGLGVPEIIEVKHKNAYGQLMNMDAEALAFEAETFDLIISLSTFEHFFDGSQVLREMHRVLKPGGSVLINFQPIWTSSYGHHLHHLKSVCQLIPPWAHLIWNEDEMRLTLKDKWTDDLEISLEDAIKWIYKSSEINRVDIVTLRNIFCSSEFEIEWMTPLLDSESDNKQMIAYELSKILPYSVEDLMTLGYSLLLNKR